MPKIKVITANNDVTLENKIDEFMKLKKLKWKNVDLYFSTAAKNALHLTDSSFCYVSVVITYSILVNA